MTRPDSPPSNELPTVPTTAVSIDSETRSTATYISFALTMFGALIATLNIANALYLQLFVLIPSIPAWMAFQIWNYFILDAILVIGVILMYGGAILIYFEKGWPYGGVIALWGAFMTIQFLSIILGGLGAFITLCSRPEPKRT
jgi:hypothetical protein